MVFQFTLYPFSLMPWRRTAVLNSFVKMQNIRYIHICSPIFCWDMDTQTGHPTVFRLHSISICSVVFLAQVCQGWSWIGFLLMQLLDQLRAEILQDQFLVKDLLSPIIPFHYSFHVPLALMSTKCIAKHPKYLKFTFCTINGEVYNHIVLQICVQHQEEKNYINGLISKLFLCNFDVQSVSLCGIHQQEGKLASFASSEINEI